MSSPRRKYSTNYFNCRMTCNILLRLFLFGLYSTAPYGNNIFCAQHVTIWWCMCRRMLCKQYSAFKQISQDSSNQWKNNFGTRFALNGLVYIHIWSLSFRSRVRIVCVNIDCGLCDSRRANNTRFKLLANFETREKKHARCGIIQYQLAYSYDNYYNNDR